MRNDNDYEGTFTYKGEGYSLTVPNSYTDSEADGSVVLANSMHGALIALSASPSPLSTNRTEDLKKAVQSVQASAAKQDGVTITEKTWIHNVGKMTCAEFQYYQTQDTSTYYTRVIIGQHQGKLYTFMISVNEMFYSDMVKKEVDEIVNSIVFE